MSNHYSSTFQADLLAAASLQFQKWGLGRRTLPRAAKKEFRFSGVPNQVDDLYYLREHAESDEKRQEAKAALDAEIARIALVVVVPALVRFWHDDFESRHNAQGKIALAVLNDPDRGEKIYPKGTFAFQTGKMRAFFQKSLPDKNPKDSQHFYGYKSTPALLSTSDGQFLCSHLYAYKEDGFLEQAVPASFLTTLKESGNVVNLVVCPTLPCKTFELFPIVREEQDAEDYTEVYLPPQPSRGHTYVLEPASKDRVLASFYGHHRWMLVERTQAACELHYNTDVDPWIVEKEVRQFIRNGWQFTSE